MREIGLNLRPSLSRQTVMPKPPHKTYLDFLRKSFGRHDVVLKHASPQGGREVSVYVFRNFPEPGMITGVTYGLSQEAAPNEEVGQARRELMISVESTDTLWAWNAAYFAAEFRGQRGFLNGEMFFADEPLASDTRMDGLLVYAPSILRAEQARVRTPQGVIQFTQLYPIYRSELVVYERYGLPALWNHPGFEIYNPKREPVVI